MIDLDEALRPLGGFHDASLLVVIWKRDEQQLSLEFKDLAANFRGLPEYKGPVQGAIILMSAELIEFQMNLSAGLRVFDWITNPLPDGKKQSVITFSPEGRIIVNHRIGSIKADRTRLPF